MMVFVLYMQVGMPEAGILEGSILSWRDEDTFTDDDKGSTRLVVNRVFPPAEPPPKGMRYRIDISDPTGALLLEEDPIPPID